jgi:hypothetical protein
MWSKGISCVIEYANVDWIYVAENYSLLSSSCWYCHERSGFLWRVTFSWPAKWLLDSHELCLRALPRDTGCAESIMQVRSNLYFTEVWNIKETTQNRALPFLLPLYTFSCFHMDITYIYQMILLLQHQTSRRSSRKLRRPVVPLEAVPPYCFSVSCSQ